MNKDKDSEKSEKKPRIHATDEATIEPEYLKGDELPAANIQMLGPDISAPEIPESEPEEVEETRISKSYFLTKDKDGKLGAKIEMFKKEDEDE